MLQSLKANKYLDSLVSTQNRGRRRKKFARHFMQKRGELIKKVFIALIMFSLKTSAFPFRAAKA